IPQNVVKVLIIYTGGTIGMVDTPHGYVPAPGFLARSLSLSSRFHDPSGFAQALGFPERSAEAARAGEVPVVVMGAEVTDGTGGGDDGGGPGHGEWPLFNGAFQKVTTS
ncbi:hypothetical protein HDU93_004232, partial [Gonapodya sp. JEL0774]